MEKHGADMATDSATLRRGSRELSDQQPIIPRRNSNEDRDTTKPRKRLAGMGSRPHSPMAIDDEEVIQEDKLFEVTVQKEPTPSAELSTGLSSQSLADSENGSTTGQKRSPSGTRITIRVPPVVQKEARKAETPESPAEMEETKSGELSPTDSNTLDGSAYGRSPELVQQVEIPDDDGDDTELAAVTVMDEDSYPPPKSTPPVFNAKEVTDNILRTLTRDDNPAAVLSTLCSYTSNCVKATEGGLEEFMPKYNSEKILFEFLPRATEVFLKRNEPFAPGFYRRQQNGRTGLDLSIHFFAEYVQLTARLLAIDLEQVRSVEEGQTVRLFSDPFIFQVMDLLFRQDAPLLQLFKHNSDAELLAERIRLAILLADEYGALITLHDLARHILNKIKTWPSFFIQAFHLLDLAANLTNLTARYCEPSFRAHFADEIALLAPRILKDVKTIYEIYDAGVKRLIDISIPQMGQREFNFYLDALATIAHNLAFINPNEALTLFRKQIGERYKDDFDPQADAMFFADWSSRWPLCLKLIKCNRMELRILGISRLIDVIQRGWQEHNQREKSASIRYMADVIEEQKLIEYLVGPESHPEILRRATVILLFLQLVGRLSPTIRDALWQPIMEGRDGRISLAVMELISDNLQHAPYEICLDYCRRITQLPLSFFSNKLMNFLPRILECTKLQFQKEAIPKGNALDEAPFRVLANALKTIYEYEADSQAMKNTLANAARGFRSELQSLIPLGPNPDSCRKLLSECIDDLKGPVYNHNRATGSLWVMESFLNCIAHPSSATKISEVFNVLLEENDIFDLFVKEFSAFVDGNRSQEKLYLNIRIEPRLSLLTKLLSLTSVEPNEEQGRKLWDYLVGEHALNQGERDHAFTRLRTLLNIDPISSFVQKCVLEHFPTLQVQFISSSGLAFLKTGIKVFNKEKHEIEDGQFVIQGINDIWRIILTSPYPAVANDAISFLVGYYLELPVPEGTEATPQGGHFQLLEKCISLLKESAPAVTDEGRVDPDAMAMDLSDEELKSRHVKFERSVMALSALINEFRVRPEVPITGKGLSEGDRGELLKFRLQIFSEGKQLQPIFAEFWSKSPAQVLHNHIIRTIKSHNYRLIVAGRELVIKDELEKPLDQFAFPQNAVLMITIRNNGVNGESSTFEENITPLDSRMLEHFDELYALLGLEEPYGRLIWNILKSLPVHENVSSMLQADELPNDILPTGHPWQIQYILNSLNVRLKTLEDESVSEEKRDAFVESTIRVLLGGVCTSDINSAAAFSPERITLTKEYFRTLNRLLKSLSDSSRLELLRKIEVPFVNALLEVVGRALDTSLRPIAESADIIEDAWSLACESAISDNKHWDVYINHVDLDKLLIRAIIEDPRASTRWHFANYICIHMHGYIQNSTDGKYALLMWDKLTALIPQCVQFSFQACEIFDMLTYLLSLLILQCPGAMDVQQLFAQWSKMIIEYNAVSPVGFTLTDHYLSGMAKLLQKCILEIRKSDAKYDNSEFVTVIFNRFLFTPYTESFDDPETRESFPVLDPITRHQLYELVRCLVQFDGEHGIAFLDLLMQLFPEDGLVAGWNIDRNRWMISPVGYAGMKNLSNTCYLNSLTTQLFMNSEFRNFILQYPVEDPEEQCLLNALQTLFAQMQAARMKAVDPTDFAMTIKNHDNEVLDIHVQMDVDEFFNLLFDRLENQMPDKKLKEEFKSIYGGQLVQQVKSKECDHTSEREEPFSAIQCDIKGKASLIESLQAYIEGEAMEGDNKYSCSKCNRHVVAVKRSCLKQIPDNLIFHLKRFEFDLDTFLRRKINDSFEFPEEIDMKPYTIDYSETNAEPDVFELVGVLVHTGTAESGHYYSFVKDSETPFTATSAPNWLHFNDSEVSAFDYSQLADNTFGGNSVSEYGTNLGPRPYSAYMLFYKRKSNKQPPSGEKNRSASIPQELRTCIMRENEQTVRLYCLFDEEFVTFMQSIVSTAHASDKTGGHYNGKRATQLAINLSWQVCSRMKESPGLDNLFQYILNTVEGCLFCSEVYLEWAIECQEGFQLMLQRCPSLKVRRTFGNLIVQAIRNLQNSSSGRRLLYSIEEMPTEEDVAGVMSTECYAQGIAEAFNRIMPHLRKLYRCWDDFFDTLINFMQIGAVEVGMLINQGTLTKALELFYMDFPVRAGPGVFRAVDRNRKPSMAKLLEFICLLQQHVSPFIDVVEVEDEDHLRLPQGGVYALTEAEHAMMFAYDTSERGPSERNGFRFIKRQLDLDINVEQTKQIIRWWLEHNEKNGNTRETMRTTLINGINVEPAEKAGPFLDCIADLISVSDRAGEIKRLIQRVASEVHSIHCSGGREHLDFFATCWDLRNENVEDPAIVRNSVLGTMPQWSPALLTYWEQDIRHETFRFINEIFLSHRSEDYTWDTAQFEKLADQMCKEIFHFIENTFISSKELMHQADKGSFDAAVRVLELCKNPNEDQQHARRILDFRTALAQYLNEEDEAFDSDNWNVSELGSDNELVNDEDST